MIKVVNANGLNMRKGPGTNHPIMQVLVKNTEVEVISESSGWSNIKYKNQVGYVSTIYLINKITVEQPTSRNEVIKKAIDIARSKIGSSYVWGAEGPNTFDCSGLMYYIFKTNLGIDIPRVSKDQSNFGKYVSRKDLMPGDLIFFDTIGTNDGKVSHVGLYLGNDEFIEASSGNVMKVVISKLKGYYDRNYVTARRII